MSVLVRRERANWLPRQRIYLLFLVSRTDFITSLPRPLTQILSPGESAPGHEVIHGGPWNGLGVECREIPVPTLVLAA